MKKIILFFILCIGIFFLILTLGYARTHFFIQRDSSKNPPEIINTNTPRGKEGSEIGSEEKKTVIKIFAEKLGPVRFLENSPDGTVVASVTKEGRVIALPDKNNDGIADSKINIITNLELPHGLAFSGNDLYIAETHQLIRLKNVKHDFSYDSKDIIISDIPGGQNHFTRSIVINNNKIYLSAGSSCNVCRESHPWRAAVIQSDLNGENIKIFSKGLRNAVGLAVNPENGQLWVTENGRDLLGENIPPDEVNILEENADYGWPICYGQKIHDSSFDKNFYIRDPCEDSKSPLHELQAHVAPLGLSFSDSSVFPEYDNNLFVALHGSWNRVVPVGYQVIRLEIKDSKIVGEQKFLDSSSLPIKVDRFRPVDVLFGKEGEIYISDDYNGKIFVVTKE